MASSPSWTSSAGEGFRARVDLLAQRDRLLDPSLPLPDARQRLDRRQAVGRLGDDLLEQRHRPRPVLPPRVVQREVGPDVLRPRGDLRPLSRTSRSACASCPSKECAVARRSAASRLPGILGEDLLEQRDRPGRTPRGRRGRRPCRDVEEADHVGRARRVLPHDRRRARADVAEARQLPPLLLPQRLRGGPGLGRRDRVVAQGRAQRPRQAGAFVPEVAGLGRVGDDVVDLHPPREDRLRPALDGHHLRLPAVREERLHRLAEDDLRLRGRAGCARRRGRPSRGSCGRPGAC